MNHSDCQCESVRQDLEQQMRDNDYRMQQQNERIDEVQQMIKELRNEMLERYGE